MKERMCPYRPRHNRVRGPLGRLDAHIAPEVVEAGKSLDDIHPAVVNK